MRTTRRAACFAAAIIGSALATNPVAAAEKVVMATEASFPPFSRTEPDGRFTGFEIDLGNEVCRRAEFECSWVKQDFDGAIAALLAGKFDIIFSSMSIKPERQKVADFSLPYYNTPSSFFAKAGSIGLAPAGIEGKVVGVYAGSTQDGYLRKRFPKATARGYENIDQITADLAAGRVDAMFVEHLAGLEFLAKPEGAGYAAIGPSLDDPELGAGAGAMLRKGNPKKAKVDAALRAIYADGTFERLQRASFPAGVDVRADKLWQ